MITCTFSGHREVYQAGIEHDLDSALSNLLETHNDSFCFLVGGMGEFDRLCASAVRRLKRTYSDRTISLNIVFPYLTQELNSEKTYYEQSYDDIIVPDELAGVHYKSAITKRNRWMIDQSQLLIAFVYRDFGGAFTTLKYAQKKQLQIINIAKSHS